MLRQHFKFWHLFIILIGQSACSTYGSITVSDPQVFTRERLVQERFEEYQWLAQQLGNYPIETKFQGLRDFREFSGVYNELGIKFDPLQGNIDTLTQETEILNKRLEKRQAEKRLADFLENHSDQTEEGVQPSSQSNQNLSAQESIKSSAVPETSLGSPENGKGKLFQKILANEFSMPKGTEGETVDKGKLSGGTTDLFHDQLAYRNTVRAAMREKQLDDAHDIFGSTMYDLQFDITLKPGEKTRRYAQVTLKIEEPGSLLTEEYYLERYCEWRKDIQDQINNKITRLQIAFQSGKYSGADVGYLENALNVFLPRQEKELYIYTQYETVPDNSGNIKLHYTNRTAPESLKDYLMKSLEAQLYQFATNAEINTKNLSSGVEVKPEVKPIFEEAKRIHEILKRSLSISGKID